MLERVTGERRIGASVQLLASLVALMLNFGALIWFAATVSAQLTDVRTSLGPLVTQGNANAIAVAVLNVRMDNVDKQSYSSTSSK